jgi:hypothetical protein
LWIAERDGVREGWICVLGCVEACRSVLTYRDKRQKQLQLVYRDRRGLCGCRVGFRSRSRYASTVGEWLAQKIKRAGPAGQLLYRVAGCAQGTAVDGEFKPRRWAGWLQRWARKVMA